MLPSTRPIQQGRWWRASRSLPPHRPRRSEALEPVVLEVDESEPVDVVRGAGCGADEVGHIIQHPVGPQVAGGIVQDEPVNRHRSHPRCSNGHPRQKVSPPIGGWDLPSQPTPSAVVSRISTSDSKGRIAQRGTVRTDGAGLTDWPLRVSTFSPSALTVIFTSQPVGKVQALVHIHGAGHAIGTRATCTLWQHIRAVFFGQGCGKKSAPRHRTRSSASSPVRTATASLFMPSSRVTTCPTPPPLRD